MKQMLVVALVTMGLGMGACGSSEKKDENPTFTPAPNAQAIVGTWGNSDATVQFDANGNYTWTTSISCQAPPCPTKATVGTYTVSGDNVILDPAEGNDEKLSISWGASQTAVTLDTTTFTKK